MTTDSREKITALLASAEEEARLDGIRALAVDNDERLLDLLFQGFADPSWRVRKEATDLFLQWPVSRQLVGEIIELLHAEENAGLRNAAVDILVRMGRDAVPFLLDQVRSPDHDVRKFIVDILGEIADQRAIPTLIEALSDEDGNVRASAAENLGKLGAREAVPALLEAMQHPDVLLRFTILDALSKIGVPVPLAKLQPFRNEQLVRKALIDCLGRVGEAAAANELLAGITDPMRNVRDASLLALVALLDRYSEEVPAILSRQDGATASEAVLGYLDEGRPLVQRRAAAQLLGWLGGSRVIAPLMAALTDESLQHDVLAALVSLCRRQPQAVTGAWESATPLQRAYLSYVFSESDCHLALPLLGKALTNGDPRLMQMAAHALGRLGGKADLAALVGCLRHEHADVRDAAAQALGLLGSQFPDEISSLLEALFADPAPEIRGAAVAVLGRLSGREVAQRLAMALKDPAAAVRRIAIKSLAGAGAADNLLAIQLTLTDEDVEVRRAAAEILGTCDNPEAVHGLHLALRDEDIWVRAAAVRSLGRLGGEAEAETIAQSLGDPVGLVSIAALETLGELLGARGCPQMCSALDHPDEEVVSVALELLSRYGAGPWLAANAEALVNHPAWNVRAHCVRLLAELLGEGAVPILERRLAVESDGLVRQQIADALAGLSVS